MNKSNIASGEEEFNAALFDARNFYYIGNFMGTINTVLPESQQSTASPELLSYMYLSYLAIDSGRLITSEIKENDTTPLVAFRHIFDYLNKPEKREDILQLFNEKLSQDVGETVIWHVAASIVFCHDGQYENALKVLHGSDDLECLALSIHCLLRMNRVDLAKQLLAKMQEKSDDATLTQLAQAWVAIASGGDQLQDAFHIFQEFCEKYQPTPLLLNGQAVCHIGQERFEEAESVLREALNKKHNDYDTLINMIVLSHLTGKSSEVINRYLEQIRQFYPQSEFIADFDKKEAEFDRLCLQYEPANKMPVAV